MEIKPCGCGRFRVWGGWSLESDDETEINLSFLSLLRFFLALVLNGKVPSATWIMVTWDF